jgi:hypothetical protein
MTTIPLSALTATWNAAGTTFTGIGLSVTDTASASGSLLLDLRVGGSSRFSVRKDGAVNTVSFITCTGDLTSEGGSVYGASAVQVGIGGSLQFSDGAAYTGILRMDAADTLAQRRGTNAQAFRIYNTFTDPSNFERGVVGWASNVFVISAEALGTGTQRVVEIRRGSDVHFRAGNGETFVGAGSAPLITLGTASASTSARIGFFNGAQLINSTLGGNAAWRITDGSGAAASLIFGGTTSSFPALKRNSTALETKLADDSAYAPHAMQYLDVTDGVTAPGAATGRARIYVDSADGDLKCVFADGTVKTIVTDT